MNSNQPTEQLMIAPIFGGMLRKPKIWGIPSDIWVLNIVVSMLVLINVNPFMSILVFVVLYGALFLLCLWDEDVFSVVRVKLLFVNNGLKKITGCNGYVAY